MDDALDVNEEHGLMLFEDYRSASVIMQEKEESIQDELKKYLDRFEKLSESWQSNNATLQVHRNQAEQLDTTLATLEGQHKRGRSLAVDLKGLLTREMADCDAVKEEYNRLATKRDKFRSMAKLFESQIAEADKEMKYREARA
jgi:chromosome segregation ATPase